MPGSPKTALYSSGRPSPREEDKSCVRGDQCTNLGSRAARKACIYIARVARGDLARPEVQVRAQTAPRGLQPGEGGPLRPPRALGPRLPESRAEPVLSARTAPARSAQGRGNVWAARRLQTAARALHAARSAMFARCRDSRHSGPDSPAGLAAEGAGSGRGPGRGGVCSDWLVRDERAGLSACNGFG